MTFHKDTIKTVLPLLFSVLLVTSAAVAGLSVATKATTAQETSTTPSAGENETLYRVNVGGPELAATDGGPAWEADATATSPYRNEGSKLSKYSAGTADETVPSETPSELFGSSRWDPQQSPEMQWGFDVPQGTQVEVRLYFADAFSGTSQPGERVFDVSLDDTVVLDDYDIVADAGFETGTMESVIVTSDGTVDINFSHVVQNPIVSGIEIVATEPTPNELGVSPTTLDFGSVPVDSTDTETVVLANLGGTGDPSITVDGATIDGADAAVFTTDFSASATLAPGDSMTVNVTFAPTSEGAKEASLSLSHSGNDAPTTVTLRGSGGTDDGGGGGGGGEIAFGSSGLAGTDLTNPTSLQFGPDGRLYVSQQDGTIFAYTVERNGSNDYAVTDTETITAVKQIPNHNDDGMLGGPTNERQITGILVTGTAANPVLYVSSSDPRIGGGSGGADTGLDTNSGVISRLTTTGSGWEHTQLVRGLPRSEENHAPNGLQLDEATNTLYVAQGGLTSKGAPSNNFAYSPEYAYSAAVLEIDLDAIGDSTYDLPTLAGTEEPFGGQDGQNMAKIVEGSPVQVYSPGYRNPYDVVVTEAGRMYVTDNGGSSGWGDFPLPDGSEGVCTNEPQDGGDNDDDQLHYVEGEGDYGGHPNPTRGNPDGAGLYDEDGNRIGDIAGAVPAANPVECDYRAPGTDGALTTFSSSTNGITEYTASNFGGAIEGDLLAASFASGGPIWRIQLNDAGDQATKEPLFSNFGSLPLDVTAQGDGGPFPGTVWAATYGSNGVTVFEPDDYDGSGGGTCSGVDDETLDEDGDGYSNADELDNGTNPCSAADKPPDHDGDGLSDLNDPDDDDDGIPDTEDAFAVDAQNGLATDLPVSYEFASGSAVGTLLDLGFTGVMSNGQNDYGALYDDNVAAGGIAEVLTVESVPDGDALGASNSQRYGFQFGVNPENEPFTVHTTLKQPFPAADGGTTPQDFQSQGVFIGTGGQDDYLTLRAAANGGNGGIQFGKEVGGSFDELAHPTESGVVGDGTVIDLSLHVDPSTNTVTGNYSVDGGETITVGETTVPESWLSNPDKGLAVGVIATSRGAPPFPATWDEIDVTTDGNASPISNASADVTMTKNGGIDASTYNSGSFEITNTGTETIESVTIDKGSALLPDLVFDPEGTAGDGGDKGFTVDSAGGTGVAGHEFRSPHNGVDGVDGYDALRIDFTDFQPGETLAFSADGDPTSIKGSASPGPNEAGSVSGLELVGSTVTVESADGSTHVARPFGDGSQGGSAGVAKADPAPTPSIDVPGVGLSQTTLSGAHTAATVASADQTVEVSGPTGATVRLLQVEAGLFTDGVPNGGYDIESYEANSALVVTEQQATIGTDGTASIDVTLTNSSPGGGLNHFVAVVEDEAGETGPTSNMVVLKLDADAPTENRPPVLDAIGDQFVEVGETREVSVNASDPDDDALALSAEDLPSFASFTDNGDGTGTLTLAPGPDDVESYGVSVSATDGKSTDTESFTVLVESDSGNQPPVLDAVGNRTIAVNETRNIAVNATDPDDDTLALSATDLPSFANFTDSGDGTGTLTLVPGPDDVGSHEMTLTATDGNATDVETITVTVRGEDAKAVLYRVNAGGSELGATDGGPAWEADATATSPYRNGGSRLSDNTAETLDETVPQGTPPELFDSARWDPPQSPEMRWEFDVPQGTQVEVRLYFRDGFSGTSQPGERVFDVAIDDSVMLDDYDIVADAGHKTGTMKSFVITSDGTVDIDFSHVVENPTVSAIEIVEADDSGVENRPPVLDAVGNRTVIANETLETPVSASDLDGDALTLSATGLPAFASFADDGNGTGMLTLTPGSGDVGSHEMTLTAGDGQANDSENVTIRVLNETAAAVLYRVNAGGSELAATDGGPAWEGDAAGSSPYRNDGSKLSDNTAETLDETVPASAPPELFDSARWDPPQSPEMGWEFDVPEGTPVEVRLYFRDGFSGTSQPGERVFDVAIDNEIVLGDYDIVADAGHKTGTMKSFVVTSDGTVDIDFAHVVENPTISAIEIVDVDDGATTQPTAAFEFAPVDPAVGETVTFDASMSNDDGTITSYEWDFDGDGQTDATGQQTTHSYTAAGNETVVLTVTDDDGVSAQVTETVNVTTSG